MAKDRVNRLQPETAAQVLRETLPTRLETDDELQMLFYDDRMVRAVNGGH